MRPALLSSLLLPLALALSLSLSGPGCSLVAPGSLGGGIGTSCTVDSDCNAARCTFPNNDPQSGSGLCATSCASNADCPSGTICAQALCQVPLAVGVALTGDITELEGWTYAHVVGLDQAAAELGYVKLDKRFGLIPGNVLPDILQIAQKNRVILGNTVDYLNDFKQAATQLPDKNFVCVDDGVYMTGNDNFTTYWAHRVSAWYVAGKVAAGIAKSRLGVISAFINPETVADVNAFTLGARSVKPNIVVEVRHMGFWFDTNQNATYKYKDAKGVDHSYFREEYLAALLVDSGCEVIAHLGNTQRSVRLIEKFIREGYIPKGTWSFANDNQKGYLDSASQPIASCVGSIYENWKPLYRDLFEGVHRGTFNPRVSLDYDLTLGEDSPTGVSINPIGPGDSIATKAIIQDLVRIKDPPVRRRIFMGPYKINGQRDKDGDGIPDAAAQQQVAAGQFLDPREIANMCWYVEGVVEKSDREVPTSMDRPALVPGGLVPGATQPGSSAPYGSYPNDKLVIPAGLSGECLKNTFPAP